MPSIDQVKKDLKEKFKSAVKGFETPLETRLFVDVDKKNIRLYAMQSLRWRPLYGEYRIMII